MSMPSESIAENRRHLERGALFLIDNPGISLPDAKAPSVAWKAFTQQAIDSHLEKHTYYYLKKRDPNSVLVVDFTRMQRHMRTLCERAQTPSTFQRRKEGYTCDEALFYSGTDGLKASALQKFGYNKATFSESDLPGHSAGGKDDGATDGSLRQSFGDAKAEASEFEDEDLDDSALDSTDNDEYDDNAFDDRMVIDHHDRDRTSQFTQQVEVQSTESPTKTSHAALLEGARQFVDNAAELRDHARPIATNRIPGAGARADRPLSTHQCLPVQDGGSSPLVQTQIVVAGHSSPRRVDADHERIEENAKPFGSSANSGKRKRGAFEDGPPTEPGSKLVRRSHSASITDPAGHPLLIPKTQHTATTNPLMSITPPEDATATAPIRLDTSMLMRELEQLKQDTLRAVDRVLNCIGQNLSEYPTALDPDPPQRLLDLYVRCWGKDWEEVRLRLTRNYCFTAPQVAMSLVAAFLYDNVFDQDASLRDDLERLRGIAALEVSTSSEALCHFLQPEQCWYVLKASAHAVNTTQAYALLAQDEVDLQSQLEGEAERLATNLCSIIVPHFRALSSFARAYGESSGKPEKAWMEAFMPAVTDIIRRSLLHRLRLRGTGCKYVYTWPDAGEEYDSRSMQIDGMPDGPDLRQQLLFTVFPGLDVTLPDGSDEKVHIRAVVKVKQLE
jgi:hypothetical protein